MKYYKVVKSRDFCQEEILNSYSQDGYELVHIRSLDGLNGFVVEYTFSREVGCSDDKTV